MVHCGTGTSRHLIQIDSCFLCIFQPNIVHYLIYNVWLIFSSSEQQVYSKIYRICNVADRIKFVDIWDSFLVKYILFIFKWEIDLKWFWVRAHMTISNVWLLV